MRLTDFLEVYVGERDLARATDADYRMVVAAFLSGRSLLLDDLTAGLFNEYLAALKARGNSPATIHSRRTKLLVLWRAAYASGATDNRPDDLRVRKVRVPEQRPVGWSAEEVRRLIAWCQTHLRRRMRLVSVPAGDYLAALFAVLWDSGMRLGDALALTFGDVATGSVAWRQSKTGRWHRAQLRQTTLAAVERIRLPERRLVWQRTGASRTALYRLIRRAAAGAGLTGSSKYIRRGGATDCERREAGSAPAYLGHVAGSRVAYRHYVDTAALARVVTPGEL